MLYDRWRQNLHDNHDELALLDAIDGRRWTFSQLDAAAEAAKSPEGSVVFPAGISLEFVLTVLRAWRAGQIVCPLEGDQARPSLTAFPPGCVHLKTTSATTGPARAIAFTGEQLAADADNIVATMGLRRDWPNLGVISLAHSYGFSNLVTPLLLHGIPLIVCDSALPEGVRRAAKLAADITLAAVPALWRVWHEANAVPPNTRLAISAGAPLPLALEQTVFDATGVKLHNFYGASECGGIAYDVSTIPRSDATCVGAPLRNVELSVNPEGCLEVRSRAVGQTYLPEPGANLGSGCYRTSDLAELKDGLIHLRGRVTDLINVAGRKVAPESIERELLAHPGVRDCLVFGVPSREAERTEVIVACVAAKTAVSADALRHFLLSKLPAWQVPREWMFVETLAANERGKLSRAEWRRRYLEQGRPG
jgi:acyl-CoA synthetase (AMP-forming)/AMP-acid ligase II